MRLGKLGRKYPYEIRILLAYTYAYEMFGWVNKADLEHEMNEFCNTIRSLDVKEIINSVIDELSEVWKIENKTINFIDRFLTSEDRIQLIETEINNYIKYLPPK